MLLVSVFRIASYQPSKLHVFSTSKRNFAINLIWRRLLHSPSIGLRPCRRQEIQLMPFPFRHHSLVESGLQLGEIFKPSSSADSQEDKAIISGELLFSQLLPPWSCSFLPIACKEGGEVAPYKRQWATSPFIVRSLFWNEGPKVFHTSILAFRPRDIGLLYNRPAAVPLTHRQVEPRSRWGLAAWKDLTLFSSLKSC